MKKIISIILSLLLVALIFAGCAKGGGTEENNEASVYALSYVYDYAFDGLDGSIKDAYTSLCDAVVNYHSELKINSGIASNAYDMFNTSFPLSFLVSDFSVLEDGTGIAIKYAKTETEHKQILSDFSKKVTECMGECFEGTTNKSVYALRAYNLVASSLEYTEDKNLNLYDAFIAGKGNSITFSKMYEFLLLQAEIPSYHIISSTIASLTPCYLTLAKLGDNYYYFDVFGEKGFTNGEGITLFGLNYNELADFGINSPLTYNSESPPESYDTKFDVCRKALSWEIEGADLLITTNENVLVKIEL